MCTQSWHYLASIQGQILLLSLSILMEVGRVTAEIEKLIDQICAKRNVDKNIVKAMVEIESDCIPTADNGKARGLMQITPIALKDVNARYKYKYTWDEMFDPVKNLEVGISYLAYLLTYYQAKKPDNQFYYLYAVAAYNWGMGKVDMWLNNVKDHREAIKIFPNETKNYIIKVLWLYNWFKTR